MLTPPNFLEKVIIPMGNFTFRCDLRHNGCFDINVCINWEVPFRYINSTLKFGPNMNKKRHIHKTYPLLPKITNRTPCFIELH